MGLERFLKPWKPECQRCRRQFSGTVPDIRGRMMRSNYCRRCYCTKDSCDLPRVVRGIPFCHFRERSTDYALRASHTSLIIKEERLTGVPKHRFSLSGD